MRNPSRREFLAAGAFAQTAVPPPFRRPNVLFLMVDEMRWDALSCEKHPLVETPNLDRLAQQGVRFTNAYTTAPLCSPSRAAAFTGRYPDVVGVTGNGIPANDGEIFLPSILKHYGYHTAIAGKLHFTPRRFSYGFDQFWSFAAEGPTPELGHLAYLRGKYGPAAGKWDRKDGSCPWPDDPLGRDVGVFQYNDEDFETEWLTDRSIDYLRSRKDNPAPWFLFTSYLKPHSPSVEPERWFGKYDPRETPIPALPPNAKEIRATAVGLAKRAWVDDEQMLRVMSAAYYGAIAHLDQQIGRILNELERLEMAGDTLIVFTSDHGNMLGDRGRFFKGVMYEGATHVPLIWKGPRNAAENGRREVRKIVENIDLLPSILETAQLPIPQGVQGRSFLRLARGQDDEWKDRCFAQLSTAMVRQGRYKFIDNSRGLTGAVELYDLRNDPKETRNLAGDPKMKEVVEVYRRDLTAWRADRPSPVQIAGLPTPDYAVIDPAEREKAIAEAPAGVAR